MSHAFLSWWQIPYYWAGTKMYDVLAGSQNMESSYAIGRGKAMEAFPMLKGEGLAGAVVYYDGESNRRKVILGVELRKREDTLRNELID